MLPTSFEENNSACVGKNMLLKKGLERAGEKVRWKEGIYAWERIGLPVELLSIPHNLEPSHVWLELLLDDNWITLDATWDGPLASTFPVNEWDGTSPQVIAFPILHMMPDSQIEIYEKPLPAWEAAMAKEYAFHRAVNMWIESKRKFDA